MARVRALTRMAQARAHLRPYIPSPPPLLVFLFFAVTAQELRAKLQKDSTIVELLVKAGGSPDYVHVYEFNLMKHGERV